MQRRPRLWQCCVQRIAVGLIFSSGQCADPNAGKIASDIAMDDLTIDLDGFDAEAALSAWQWLLPASHRPIALSYFGDWLLEAPDGDILLMDTLEGQITHLVPSRAQLLDSLAQDPALRDEWLLEGLAIGMREKGIELRPGQCFGFKVPPILGAPISVDNIQVTDIVPYQLFVGQLHQRLASLPPGTAIGEITVD